jgi:hypothetical protein
VATLEPDDDEDRSEPDVPPSPADPAEPSVRVSVQNADDPPVGITRSADGARRPQPQRKPRSQRKK